MSSPQIGRRFVRRGIDRQSIGRALWAASFVIAVTPSHGQSELLKLTCGTVTPDAAIVAETNRVVQNLRLRSLDFLRQISPTSQSVVIPTRFHIVARDAIEGQLTDAKIREQLAVMNKAYAPLRIQFAMSLVTREINPTWFESFNEEGADAVNMARVNPSGGADLLVVVRRPRTRREGFVLGHAHYPESIASGGVSRVYDAAVIHWQSLPGGNAISGLGITAVHEVGHWLGLKHTFEPGFVAGVKTDGCSSPGDAVDDTPYQRSATNSCPVSADTCPSVGLDPVNNYMNYAYDSCMTEFTNGQSERAMSMLAQYRPQFLRMIGTARKVYGLL